MLAFIFVFFVICIFFVSSQRSPSPGPNHVMSSNTTSASALPSASGSRSSCSFTPTLATHFSENLIKHVQGWPAEHAEKQVCCAYSLLHDLNNGQHWGGGGVPDVSVKQDRTRPALKLVLDINCNML